MRLFLPIMLKCVKKEQGAALADRGGFLGAILLAALGMGVVLLMRFEGALLSLTCNFLPQPGVPAKRKAAQKRTGLLTKETLSV